MLFGNYRSAATAVRDADGLKTMAPPNRYALPIYKREVSFCNSKFRARTMNAILMTVSSSSSHDWDWVQRCCYCDVPYFLLLHLHFLLLFGWKERPHQWQLYDSCCNWRWVFGYQRSRFGWRRNNSLATTILQWLHSIVAIIFVDASLWICLPSSCDVSRLFLQLGLAFETTHNCRGSMQKLMFWLTVVVNMKGPIVLWVKHFL